MRLLKEGEPFEMHLGASKCNSAALSDEVSFVIDVEVTNARAHVNVVIE